MQLVDMQNDRRDPEITILPILGEDDPDPTYPDDLRVTIADDQLDRLALDDDALEVGTTVRLEAIAKVVAYAEDESVDDEPRCRLELQITRLGLEPDESARRARAEDERLDALAGVRRYIEDR
jgi:hypothetical protein